MGNIRKRRQPQGGVELGASVSIRVLTDGTAIGTMTGPGGPIIEVYGRNAMQVARKLERVWARTWRVRKRDIEPDPGPESGSG